MARALAQALRRAARDLDRQPSAGRPQSLDRSSAALLGGDARRAARRSARQIVERHYRPYRARGRAPRRAIGVARPARDPHFVAQLHAGAGRQGATRRRRSALRPRAAAARRSCARAGRRRSRRIAPGAPRAPQLSVCRQGRRADVAPAPALSADAPTSGSSWRSTRRSSSPRAAAGPRCAAR